MFKLKDCPVIEMGKGRGEIKRKYTQKSEDSKYLGVTKTKSGRRFMAQIRVDNQNVYLGNFANELDAAHARDEYVLKHNLKRKLNFPSIRP